MAAPYGYALLVQELGEVVRMNVRQEEGDEARSVLLGAVDGDIPNLGEPPVSVLSQPPLVLPNVVHPQSVEVVHGRPEPHDLGYVHSPGLELVGQLVPGRVLEVDLPDHLPSAKERVHL